MELKADLMVNPRVRLVEPLGQGSMGDVWIADHLTLNTQVAVKFISDDFAKDNPEIIARFKREASVAAQIKSPYVVQTFDQGLMGDDTPYIVMELLEGESLQERLDRLGHLSHRESGQVVAQIARALRKAHGLGIVHRDIKPDNIFITENDDGVFCKVLDFGIAKQTKLPKMGGLTNPGLMIGTPEFMSPEQVLSAKDVDHQADLWALAVVAYQLLTGQLPFEEETIGLLCVRLLDAQFKPASELHDELGPSVDAWFAKALDRNVDARFNDARELAIAFVQALPDDTAELEASLMHSIGGRGMQKSLPVPTVHGIGSFDPSSAEKGTVDVPVSDRNTLGETMASGPEERAERPIATLSGAFASVRPMVKKWSRPAVTGLLILSSLIAVGIVVTSNSADLSPETTKHPAHLSLPTETSDAASKASKPAQPDPSAAAASSASAAAMSSAELAASATPENSAKAAPSAKPRILRRRRPGKTKRQRYDHGF